MNNYIRIEEDIKKILIENNPEFDSVLVTVENQSYINVEFICNNELKIKDILKDYSKRVFHNTNLCQNIIDKYYESGKYKVTVNSKVTNPNPDTIEIKMKELFSKLKNYIYFKYEQPKISLGCDYNKEFNLICIELYYSEELDLDIDVLKIICKEYEKDYNVDFYYKKVKYY